MFQVTVDPESVHLMLSVSQQLHHEHCARCLKLYLYTMCVDESKFYK